MAGWFDVRRQREDGEDGKRGAVALRTQSKLHALALRQTRVTHAKTEVPRIPTALWNRLADEWLHVMDCMFDRSPEPYLAYQALSLRVSTAISNEKSNGNSIVDRAGSGTDIGVRS